MKISRKSFISKLFFGALGFIALDAFWFEKYVVDWTVYDISKNETGKIKVIQLSDLHLHKIKSFHRTIAKRINKENPDAILITGDSINYTSELSILDEFLKLIDHHILKIATLGNKEYEGRIDFGTLRSVYEVNNGMLLINQNHVLNIKNRAINIMGIDDYLAGNADYFIASQNANTSLETIVLNHRPKYRDEIDSINKSLKIPLKLILCGHTHGGQVTFFGKVIFKPTGSGRYLKGWYKSDESLMYVSKGIGTSIIDVRFGARAEASIFYV